MCVVSMVMDHYEDEWRRRLPYVHPYPTYPLPSWPPSEPPTPVLTPEQIEEIGKQIGQAVLPPKPITPEEIAEFRRLLDRAREYDKRNNEPECEMESKRQKLLDLAKELGIDISFV